MRQGFAHEARLELDEAADEAAVGAAITQALCGDWQHDGPCPLAPHHTATERQGGQVTARVLFATEPDSEPTVRRVIDEVLARGGIDGPRGRVTWHTRAAYPSELLPDEREHAERLMTSWPDAVERGTGPAS